LGYKHMEPPPGADPGHPPYEGGAAAVRGGKSYRGWDRTSVAKDQSLDGMPTTHPVSVRKARVERASREV